MRLTVEQAVEEIAAGRMIIVVDDENRENEGDIVCAAETITPDQVNFIVKEARGLLCTPMTPEWAEHLQLTPMTHENTALHSTNFTVSVDAVEGTTTGISAQDRAETIQKLADPAAKASDFARPGHVFPLVAKKGGVVRRSGHTEAVVDLLRMGKRTPVGVLCEIMDEDGSMARMPSLERFSEEHGMGILTIEDLIAYRNSHETLFKKIMVTEMPTVYGHFTLHLYEDLPDGKEHIALVRGNVDDGDPVLVRVHSQCLTGDTFGSLRCDCGEQFEFAMQKIQEEERGVLLYMPQEGRGIGLAEKLKAYALQDEGYDTVEANLKLGHKIDSRDYGIGAQILADLGVRKMRLMTNNPKKIVGLSAFGLEIAEQIPLKVPANPHNLRYLEAKRTKMGHLI